MIEYNNIPRDLLGDIDKMVSYTDTPFKSYDSATLYAHTSKHAAQGWPGVFIGTNLYDTDDSRIVSFDDVEEWRAFSRTVEAMLEGKDVR